MKTYIVTLRNNTAMKTVFYHKGFFKSKKDMIQELLNLDSVTLEKYVILKINKLK